LSGLRLKNIFRFDPSSLFQNIKVQSNKTKFSSFV